MLKRLGDPDEGRAVIGVWRMAAALTLAAFLGGAVGLAWQKLGGSDEEQEQPSDLAAQDER